MAYNFGTDSRAPQAIASHRDSAYMTRRWYRSISSVLLSLLAVVLGFDGICGERERGTLKQLLTNPIPRAHVVLGKLVGGVISLCVPLTSFLLCLLIVVANDDVVLSADDWVRVAILYGLTCAFLVQIFALSLMVSTVATASVTAEMLSPDAPYMLERLAWAEAEQVRAVEDDRRQLDLTDLPRFGGRWQRSLGESFALMTPGLAVLVLTLGAGIMVTAMRFLRYDPS